MLGALQRVRRRDPGPEALLRELVRVQAKPGRSETPSGGAWAVCHEETWGVRLEFLEEGCGSARGFAAPAMGLAQRALTGGAASEALCQVPAPRGSSRKKGLFHQRLLEGVTSFLPSGA
ncbi:unnamed protein product [Natator depressus]